MSTTGFLDICGAVSMTVNDTHATGEAVLHSLRFRHSGSTAEVSLLIEGLHQFAVRLARQITLRDRDRTASAGRLLPVAIKSLEILRQVDPFNAECTLLRGDVVAFGATLRVHVRGLQASSGAEIVRATIVVAEVGRTEAHRATMALGDPVGGALVGSGSVLDFDAAPLFLPAALTRGADSFAFIVNPRCALLDEHFPGFPIAPGSLVLEHVATRFRERFGSAFVWNRLSDVQFIGPIVPGQTFRGRSYVDGAQVCKGPRAGYAFTLLTESDNVVMRGTFVRAPSHEWAGAACA